MTDAQLRASAGLWLTQGRPAMLVSVLSHQGSVPREAGSRMLVAADAVAGTIGGGQLELQAISAARQALAAEANQAFDQPLALGPSLGQCCGGRLVLRTEVLSPQALAAWPDEPPLFRLQLYGAGHVGRAIAALLADLPCQVSWIDEREAEFPATVSPPHVQRICADQVQHEVRQAAAGAYYLVLTHSHALDLAITEAVLRRGDFGFLGLIGSASKRARFLHRFEAAAVPAAALARLVCPIGLPGLPGKLPAVLAISVVAQLLQVAAAAGQAQA